MNGENRPIGAAPTDPATKPESVAQNTSRISGDPIQAARDLFEIGGSAYADAWAAVPNDELDRPMPSVLSSTCDPELIIRLSRVPELARLQLFREVENVVNAAVAFMLGRSS